MREFVTSRFRDLHPANVLSARLELLCAANLAVRRTPFAFGGKGEPDVTRYPGTAAQGWLEIHVDKAGQGRRGSWDPARTVLLIDISTARLIQFLGQDGLAAWLDEVPVEWEDLPFAGVAVCFSHLHGSSLWESCRYRPDLAGADRALLEPALTAVGLPTTPDQ